MGWSYTVPGRSSNEVVKKADGPLIDDTKFIDH